MLEHVDVWRIKGGAQSRKGGVQDEEEWVVWWVQRERERKV